MKHYQKKALSVFLTACMLVSVFALCVAPVTAGSTTVTNSQQTFTLDYWQLPVDFSIAGVDGGTSVSKSINGNGNTAVSPNPKYYGAISGQVMAYWLYTWQSAGECTAAVTIDRSLYSDIDHANNGSRMAVTVNYHDLIGCWQDYTATYAPCGIELSADTSAEYILPYHMSAGSAYTDRSTVTVSGTKGGSYTYSLLNSSGALFANEAGIGPAVTNGSSRTLTGFLSGPAPAIGESVTLRVLGFGGAWSSNGTTNGGAWLGEQENFINLTITGACYHNGGHLTHHCNG
ncbi:MAG: hypothetical protein IJK40_01935, partial [Clostridia bacterium]|nr:hypothetical protein [Clostridia bacterium]